MGTVRVNYPFGGPVVAQVLICALRASNTEKAGLAPAFLFGATRPTSPARLRRAHICRGCGVSATAFCDRFRYMRSCNLKLTASHSCAGTPRKEEKVKKILLTTTALIALGIAPAVAADLAARPYTKAPPMGCDVQLERLLRRR